MSKRDPVKKSVLALLLAESSKQAGNPFLKYSKYNGEVSRCTVHTFRYTQVHTGTYMLFYVQYYMYTVHVVHSYILC